MPAFRGSAIVNEATLGTEPHDLSRYLSSAGQFAAALDRNPPALKALITDFNTTAAALASEQEALEATITELPRTLRVARPALAALNSSFPAVRRLTADLRPATRSTGPMIDASLPLITQLRLLVSQDELRGTVADLRELTPELAKLNDKLPELYEEVREAASCHNEVIVPWANDRVEDPNFKATGKVYQESVKGLPGLGGESRSGDANGQWARVLAGNGVFTYVLDVVGQSELGQTPLFGNTGFRLQGSTPPKSKEPTYRYDVPCETQKKPNLETVIANPLEQVAGPLALPARLTALGEALTYEQVAGMLEEPQNARIRGARGRAGEFRERAAKLRKRYDLDGLTLGVKNGRYGIMKDEDAEEDEESGKRGKDDEESEEEEEEGETGEGTEPPEGLPPAVTGAAPGAGGESP
jgi:hypothetical protein